MPRPITRRIVSASGDLKFNNMPANLPPDYFEEEKKLRQAKSIDEKIGAIAKMLAIIPHHKGTDKLIGSLRAKVAKLWRKGRYDGMMVSRDFVLEDKDVIELHI